MSDTDGTSPSASGGCADGDDPAVVSSPFFDRLPDPALRYSFADGEPIVAAANSAFESSFDYCAEGIVGDPLVDLVVPGDGDGVDDRLAARIRSGERVDTSIHVQSPAGCRPFQLRTVRLQERAPAEWAAIYTDRTAEKRREQYESLVETVGDPMYVLDANGVVQEVNHAMETLLGRPRDDIVGRHPRAFMPKDSVRRGVELIEAILADPDRETTTFELDVERADGSTIECADTLAVVTDETGNFRGSVGVVRDVTERKRYERTFAALQRTTRDFLTASTVEETIEIAVTAAESVLELPLATVHRYDPETDTLRPTVLTDEFLTLYNTTYERFTFDRGEGLTGGAFADGESRAYEDIRSEPALARENPKVRSVMLFPLSDHGLLFLGSMEVDAFDHVDQYFAEILAATTEAALDRAVRHDELQSREVRLERQNDRLESFASVVSHDLRNPLNVAEGYLDLAKTDGDDAIEHIERAEAALDRIGTLIDDLLSLAREGKRVDDPVPVDLDAIVHEAWDTVADDPATLVVNSVPDVAGDRSRLRQLFENLFVNAVEHGPSDVTVTVGTYEEEGTVAGLYVADDGPGIDPEIADSVFEWGFTTDTTGTGFGLAIVAEIAEAHGWDVDLVAEDGARFEFRF
ncbi:MAG: PAS domain-containing sensor histidine kinase [Halobacteriota archaeon]